MKSFNQFLTERISGSGILKDFNQTLDNASDPDKEWYFNYKNAIKTYLQSLFPKGSMDAFIAPPILSGNDYKGSFEFTMAGAYVNTVTILIGVPNTFDIENSKDKKKLERLIIHELVHANQVANANEFLKANNLKVTLDTNKPEEYFTNKMEIEAYATQAALETLTELHPEEIKGGRVGKFRKASPAFNHYYKMFAKDNKDVWQRFLKKFYQSAVELKT